MRQSCRSARAASRGSAMNGQKGGKPREAELALRWCRTKGRTGQAPSGRAAAPLVPHKGRKGASPERTSCRSAGAAQRAAKGASPERASCRSAGAAQRAAKGASPEWQSCCSAGAAQRAERGKPRKGELSLSRCRTKGSKRGQAPKGRAVAQPVLHKGQQTSGRAAAPPRGRRSRMSGSRARRVRHAPAHQRQYGRMLCGGGGPATRGLRGPSTPCHCIAVSEVA